MHHRPPAPAQPLSPSPTAETSSSTSSVPVAAAVGGGGGSSMHPYKHFLGSGLRSGGCMPSCMSSVDPFLEAVELGHCEQVSRLLAHRPSLMRQSAMRSRRTAWHIAAQFGHLDILKVLASAICASNRVPLSGSLRRLLSLPSPSEELLLAYINKPSRHGATPLMLAAYSGHAECVKFLISLGADPWRPDSALGMVALHHAAKVGRSSVIRELLHEAPPTSSAGLGNNPHRPSYVDALDSVGFSALHYATWACKLEAMQVLISHGAKLVVRSVQCHPDWPGLPPGVTPLHIAAMRGELDQVKILLRTHFESFSELVPSAAATPERTQRARSRPDPRLILTRHSRLPYHMALRAGHTQLLEWLDPSLPLMFLFSNEDSGVDATSAHTIGVPRLAILSANALHDHLLQRLVTAFIDLERFAKEAPASSSSATAAAPSSHSGASSAGAAATTASHGSGRSSWSPEPSATAAATATRRSQQPPLSGAHHHQHHKTVRRRHTDDGISLLRRLTIAMNRGGGSDDRSHASFATTFMRMGLSIPEDPDAEVAEFDPLSAVATGQGLTAALGGTPAGSSLPLALGAQQDKAPLPAVLEEEERTSSSSEAVSTVASAPAANRPPPPGGEPFVLSARPPSAAATAAAAAAAAATTATAGAADLSAAATGAALSTSDRTIASSSAAAGACDGAGAGDDDSADARAAVIAADVATTSGRPGGGSLDGGAAGRNMTDGDSKSSSVGASTAAAAAAATAAAPSGPASVVLSSSQRALLAAVNLPGEVTPDFDEDGASASLRSPSASLVSPSEERDCATPSDVIARVTLVPAKSPSRLSPRRTTPSSPLSRSSIHASHSNPAAAPDGSSHHRPATPDGSSHHRPATPPDSSAHHRPAAFNSTSFPRPAATPDSSSHQRPATTETTSHQRPATTESMSHQRPAATSVDSAPLDDLLDDTWGSSHFVKRSLSTGSMVSARETAQEDLRRQVLLGDTSEVEGQERDGGPYIRRQSMTIAALSLAGEDTVGGGAAARGAAASRPGGMAALLQNLRKSFMRKSNVVKPTSDVPGSPPVAAAARGAAVAADEDEEDVCPVCLDHAPNIMAKKCGHRLCLDCAQDLCQRHYLTPALCPYCRAIIADFVACRPNAPHTWTPV